MGTADWFQYGSDTGYLHPIRARQIATIDACVSLIAGTIAQLPVAAKRLDRAGNLKQTNAGHLGRLLNLEPCPAYSAVQFWETVVSEVLLLGNSYAYIRRDGSDQVGELVPVTCDLRKVELKNGRLFYHLNSARRAADDLPETVIEQKDILHFTSGVFDGCEGRSILEMGAATAANVYTSMDDFLLDYYRHGAHADWVIQFQDGGEADQKTKDEVKAAFKARHAQGLDGKAEPIVIGSEVQVQRMETNLRENQMTEGREFQIDEIARAFRVPSYLINREQKTTSFGSGITEISRSFLRYCIGPHLHRLECELNRKLTPPPKMTRLRFDTAELIRASTQERAAAHTAALGSPGASGWASINEVRKMEGLMPLPGAEYDRVALAGSGHPEPEPPA